MMPRQSSLEALPGTPFGTFVAIGLCRGALDHVTWFANFHLDLRLPGLASCSQCSQSYRQYEYSMF